MFFFFVISNPPFLVFETQGHFYVLPRIQEKKLIGTNFFLGYAEV